MLIERVLGNVNDAASQAWSTREQDPVQLQWWELDRRAWKKTTVSGQVVRLLLPRGTFLADGDVLGDDGRSITVVRLAETDVWILRPRGPTELATLALELGNLHAPTQIVGEELWVAPDGPIESRLRELGAVWIQDRRRFAPRLCAGLPSLKVADDLRIRVIPGSS